MQIFAAWGNIFHFQYHNFITQISYYCLICVYTFKSILNQFNICTWYKNLLFLQIYIHTYTVTHIHIINIKSESSVDKIYANEIPVEFWHFFLILGFCSINWSSILFSLSLSFDHAILMYKNTIWQCNFVN